MGTAVLNDEIEIGAMELFKTKFATNELISESKIEEKKLSIEKRTKERDNLCFFHKNQGVDFYLYHISNEEVTTINPVHLTEPVGESEVYKFGYLTPSGEIKMLYGNHFVSNGREQLKSIFKNVQEYCVGKGEPFAFKK
jgi:hypothetical protein